jgi:hypothetical protein
LIHQWNRLAQFRATSEREKLIEQVKDRSRIDEDSKAIDEALRCYISFMDLTDQLRAEARLLGIGAHTL